MGKTSTVKAYQPYSRLNFCCQFIKCIFACVLLGGSLACNCKIYNFWLLKITPYMRIHLF